MPEQSQPAIVKFRGGAADGQYRIALTAVPATIRVTDGRGSQLYAYAGEEPQTRAVNAYDPKSKTNSRTIVVEAVFHIFRPAEAP